jgi:hypothetical protein
MLEACMTRIESQDAIALVDLLAEICGRPAPKVTWSRGMRAWAYPRERRIHLPRVTNGLHVEMVVHEFAHPEAEADAPESAACKPHGGCFVLTLDRLLLESWPTWQAKKPSGAVLLMQSENRSERHQRCR